MSQSRSAVRLLDTICAAKKAANCLLLNVQTNSADYICIYIYVCIYIYIYIYSLKKKHAEFFKTLLLNMTNVGIKKCKIYSIMPKKCAMKKQEKGKMTMQKILNRIMKKWMYIYRYMYVYIYIERERERYDGYIYIYIYTENDIDTDTENDRLIYIYIYRYRYRYRFILINGIICIYIYNDVYIYIQWYYTMIYPYIDLYSYRWIGRNIFAHLPVFGSASPPNCLPTPRSLVAAGARLAMPPRPPAPGANDLVM